MIPHDTNKDDVLCGSSLSQSPHPPLPQIHPDDRCRVPAGGADKSSGKAAEPPGSDFLQQLREFTDGFRLRLGQGGEVLRGVSEGVKNL